MRVIVAEDAPLLRQGLVRLLEDCGVEVVGQTGDAADVLTLAAREEPDAVLLDIRMPPTHTDEGLLLSRYVETSAAVEVLAREPRGFGYLLKERVADADELYDALKRVAAGESAIDPEIVARLLERRRADSLLDGLTARERQVLALMAEGRSNEAISGRLGVSAKTLETHIRSVFTKLRLEPGLMDNRRVLAVLTYLRA